MRFRFYFPAIPHDRLLALLARRCKGGVLDLIAWLLERHHDSPGRGLPIGALTSQHFANQYLGEADRFALALPACAGHLRYMDDIVLWCRSRTDARTLHDALRGFCAERLRLTLKPPVLMPSDQGLGLCGMRVYPGAIKLGLRRRRALRQRRRHWEVQWQQGQIDSGTLQRAYDSLHGMTLPANSLAWRRAALAQRPAPD